VDRSWTDLNSSISSDCEDLSIRYQDLQDDYRRQRDCSIDSAYLPRLEHSWGGRTQMTPNFVKLHPFQTEIAVAYRDKVMLSNWSSGVIQSFLPTRQPFSPRHLTLPGGIGNSNSNISTSHHYVMSSSPDNRRSSQPHYMSEGGSGGIGGSSGNLAPQVNGHVTSIDFINPHYRTLLMVSHSDYIVRIWRQMAHQACNATSTCDKFTSNDDDHLVTAWVAFSEQTDLVRPTTLCGGNFITQWHQRTNTAFAGGVTKFIRLWNAEKEMKEVDYPAGSDHPISLISCPVNEVNLFVTGYGDGCVRLFDRRLAPSEAKVMSYHEHGDSLIELCMKNDGHTIISAW
jgi:regulatory associated protein of mTOR